MKNVKEFEKQCKRINQIFCNYLKEKNYDAWNFDEENMKKGAFACKDDKFVPIIKLHNWRYPESHSISVIDRNGNTVIEGETAAVYSLEIDEKDNNSIDEIAEMFEIMLNEVYLKYGNYDRNNRLDFAFNELEIDRKNFNLNDNEVVL